MVAELLAFIFSKEAGAWYGVEAYRFGPFCAVASFKSICWAVRHRTSSVQGFFNRRRAKKGENTHLGIVSACARISVNQKAFERDAAVETGLWHRGLKSK